MAKGEYDKAIGRLEASLDLNSDLPETYYNLGVAYYQTNNYEEAEKFYNEILEISENNYWLIKNFFINFTCIF